MSSPFLRIPTKHEFLSLRPQRYSEFALTHDDPARPLPDEAAEDAWWQTEVATGRHRLALLTHPDIGDCALVHAFSFVDEGRGCEVGFSLLSPDHGGRGLATLALQLWLTQLAASGVRTVTSETSKANQAARGVLARSGFHPVETYTDGPIEWEVWERELAPDLVKRYSSASPSSQ